MAFLFEVQNKGGGIQYDAEYVYHVLKEIGADDCEALFLHTDVMFGSPAPGIRRKEYLGAFYDILQSLHVKYLIVPTFTYSFCNKEDFDVRTSPTSMGALNEFIRKQEARYRTLDPLLSLSVPIALKERFAALGRHSLGVGSGMDMLHQMDGVKFLFFGARLGECFTYVHYVEKILDVPYRFDLAFSGNVIDWEGNLSNQEQYIHTACSGVKTAEYHYFEDYLADHGFLKRKRLGNKQVSCIFEKDAYREIANMLRRDINYFLQEPFQKSSLAKTYTMGLDGRKITHC